MVHLNDVVKPANRLVSAVLRSPAHVVASKGLMVVGWNGRESGRAFSIPVGYQLRDGVAIVLISKPDEKNWWKNFRSPWPAELLIRRESHDATGVLIAADQPEFFEHCERSLRRMPWLGSQFGGVKYDKVAGLTDDQRDVLAANVAVVRFDL